MDPPDVLGMDSGIARPTKLPNRAKSKYSQTCASPHRLSVDLQETQNVLKSRSVTVCFSEQPPPRPPQPAVLLKSMFFFFFCAVCNSMTPIFTYTLMSDWRLLTLPEPFYDSVMDDYDDDDDASASSGLKRLGVSLGLKLRPWEGSGVRSAKSEVSLIDFTDDSFSSTTPSPLTETRQPDEDTLKVQLDTAIIYKV